MAPADAVHAFFGKAGWQKAHVTHAQHVCALLHLSGQGPAKTRLVFPKSLAAVLGSSTTYTYGPAFIQFNGANWLNAQTFLATVTAVRQPSALA